jgi:ubiquinone/menaquinone biosynthesis C-methylase UbiE
MLRRLLKRIQGGSASAGLSRHAYKEVWVDLSTTEDSAKVWVQGSTDEGQLARSADYFVAQLDRLVGIHPVDDIMEIGCGVGRVGAVLAGRCRSWTGADVSANMLSHTRRRLASHPNVRTVELSGYDLGPIASESLDLVYCTVVFMHVSEWERFSYIEEARRVLRPGGRLYVDNVSLRTGYGWDFFQSSRAIPPERRPPQIGQTSTPQEFEVYFGKAGFTDFTVQEIDDAWVVGTGRK